MAGICLLLVMDGWEILKRWATYWQCRELEIIALVGLSSHFSITLIPTAVPISAQHAVWFLQVPPNPAFLQIWGFRNGYSHWMSLSYRNPLPGCVKGTTLQPFSLSHSIQSFLRCSQAAYLLLLVISSAIFCFARFLFLMMLVFLHICAIIKFMSFTLLLSELRTYISGLDVSKQSEQRRKQMIVTTAFCVSYGRFVLIYSFVLV